MSDDSPEPSSVWQVVAETAERSGLGHIKPNDLRRTPATELVETGALVHHVQAQLGHANAQTTLQDTRARWARRPAATAAAFGMVS